MATTHRSDDLIREAGAFVDRFRYTRPSYLIYRLADALEGAEAELDAALAVIEEAREAIGEVNEWDGHGRADQLDNTRRALASVPADVLRERDRQVRAEARAEGLHEALTVLPRPDEDARSGMVHARGLIAARLIEQNSEGNDPSGHNAI